MWPVVHPLLPKPAQIRQEQVGSSVRLCAVRSLCVLNPSARGSPRPPPGHAPHCRPPPAAPASSRSPSREGGTGRRGPPSHQPPPIKTRHWPPGSRLQRPIRAARTVFASGVRDLGAGTLRTKLRSRARRRRKPASGRGLPRDGPRPRSG